MMTSKKDSPQLWIMAITVLAILASIIFMGSRSGNTFADEHKFQSSEPTEPPVWITLLALSPTPSARELFLHHRTQALTPDGVKVTSCRLEIRSTKNNRRMANIDGSNFFHEHIHKDKPLKWSGWRDHLNERQARHIGTLDDGEYVLSIYVNEVRCSNVSKIRIDSDFDPAAEPTLQVVPIEVRPGQKLRYVGLQAVGPTPQDSTLTNMALSFPELVVDGVRRKVKGYNWSGPVFSLKPGQQHEEILDMSRYEPAIDLKSIHKVKAIVGKYESPTAVIGLDTPLGRSWDQMTATVKPRLPLPIALKGKVIGANGKPGVDYQVRLIPTVKERIGKQVMLSESSRKDGIYEFPNVPPGEYKLYCNASGETEPQMTIEQMQIKKNETLIKDMIFRRDCSFSGKVCDETGLPVTDITVAARWETNGRRTVLRDVTRTDDSGRYTLGAPFEVATMVAIGSAGPDFVPSRRGLLNVKAGRSDVDFVLWTKAGRAAALANALKELSVQVDDAVRNVDEDPSLVLSLFIQLQNKQSDLPEDVIGVAQKYIHSENPLIRFCANWTMGDVLYRQRKDPSSLTYFDRAIETHEDVYAIISKFPVHHGTIDDIYRYKISACLYLGHQEAARQTALRGAQLLTSTNRFNHAIDWLCFYCVTEVLDQQDAKQGLAICDAYLRAYERDRGMHQVHHHAAIIKARETFIKALAKP